ncbi:hypothetical protein M3J09_004955 [Ascochyta lentis]
MGGDWRSYVELFASNMKPFRCAAKQRAFGKLVAVVIVETRVGGTRVVVLGFCRGSTTLEWGSVASAERTKR